MICKYPDIFTQISKRQIISLISYCWIDKKKTEKNRINQCIYCCDRNVYGRGLFDKHFVGTGDLGLDITEEWHYFLTIITSRNYDFNQNTHIIILKFFDQEFLVKCKNVYTLQCNLNFLWFLLINDILE